MLETNRRDVIGQTLLDYSKLIFAAQFATELWQKAPALIRVVLFLIFVILFLLGWWCSPPKKEK